ncbi:ATP-binding protein [Brevibacillus panacihumi]|uniref:ATP-binding protein n=1 Tax=Brevibacillus panacihumi TaxID=497735 RepID=UPI003D02E5C9
MKNRSNLSDAMSAQIQDKMRQTLQNLQNVVFTYTKREDGTLIYNLYEGRIAEELGLTTDRIYGKTLHEVFTAEKADYLTHFYNEAFKGTTVTYEFEYAGRIFYNVLSPIVADGEVVEVVGSAIDISDRKKMELELAKARDQALLSSRLKSEFLSTMSHEIRTPMNGIIGMLDLLLQSPLNADQQRYANIIKNSANSLLAIINDILDFSKMEAGKTELEIHDFQLLSLVEDILELMAAKAMGKQLSLYAYVDPSIPAVLRGDSGRIRQTLLNLIGNAIKFTNQGEIAIRVTVETPHPRTPIITFSVRDTGIGIPESAFPRLFQPFTQIDGSASRQFGGTGLGLSICKHIVQMMEGTIDFESEVDKGSTFTFSIPLEVAPDHPEPARSPALPKRILCLLKSQREFAHIQEILSHLDVSCVCAANVADACSLYTESAQGDPFQVLITDVEEYELLPLYPNLKGSLKPKIIKIHSSFPSMHEKKQSGAYPLSFDSYLSRPIKQSQLLYLLGHLQDREVQQSFPHLTEPAPGNYSYQILVAEDNEVNAEIVMLQLQQLGLYPHHAKNGIEALSFIARHNYDLILMDCQMPEMNGFETTRRIRHSELSHGRHVPIVALTANAMREDRELCLEAGMDDYLSKPFTYEQLQSILKKWLPGIRPTKLLFDKDKVTQLFRGDRQEGKQKWLALIQTFEKQNHKALTELKEAVAKRDRQAFSSIIHSTRSGCAFIGAISLVELLTQLEEIDCAVRPEEASARLSTIQEEFGKVHAYLRGLQL